MPKVVAGYKAQARTRIADAAQTVFRRKGFRTATMDDIAKEIGVSKGALYLYFRTKTDLLVEIQTRARAQLLRQWESLLEAGDIAEGFTRSLDPIFSGAVDPGIWYELAGESASDPAVRTAIVVDQREDARQVRRFLEKLEERGRIPKVRNPEVVAYLILALFQASVLEVMLQGHPADTRRRLTRALRYVLGLEK